MATFTVTITDPAFLAGITAARNAYNDSLTPVRDKDGNVIGPSLDTITTDQDYVQYVMEKASESYAKNYGVTITTKEKAALQLRLATAIVKD